MGSSYQLNKSKAGKVNLFLASTVLATIISAFFTLSTHPDFLQPDSLRFAGQFPCSFAAFFLLRYPLWFLHSFPSSRGKQGDTIYALGILAFLSGFLLGNGIAWYFLTLFTHGEHGFDFVFSWFALYLSLGVYLGLFLLNMLLLPWPDRRPPPAPLPQVRGYLLLMGALLAITLGITFRFPSSGEGKDDPSIFLYILLLYLPMIGIYFFYKNVLPSLGVKMGLGHALQPRTGLSYTMFLVSLSLVIAMIWSSGERGEGWWFQYIPEKTTSVQIIDEPNKEKEGTPFPTLLDQFLRSKKYPYDKFTYEYLTVNIPTSDENEDKDLREIASYSSEQHIYSTVTLQWLAQRLPWAVTLPRPAAMAALPLRSKEGGCLPLPPLPRGVNRAHLVTVDHLQNLLPNTRSSKGPCVLIWVAGNQLYQQYKAKVEPLAAQPEEGPPQDRPGNFILHQPTAYHFSWPQMNPADITELRRLTKEEGATEFFTEFIDFQRSASLFLLVASLLCILLGWLRGSLLWLEEEPALQGQGKRHLSFAISFFLPTLMSLFTVSCLFIYGTQAHFPLPYAAFGLYLALELLMFLVLLGWYGRSKQSRQDGVKQGGL